MNEISFKNYDLSAEIRRALSVLKYETPTEVQSQVIPKAMENQETPRFLVKHGGLVYNLRTLTSQIFLFNRQE